MNTSANFTSAAIDQTFLDRLRALRNKIVEQNDWLMSLCESFDASSEMETMIAQTVLASITNLDGEPKEAFSYLPKGGLKSSRVRCADNDSALANLISAELMVQEPRGDREVLFVTPKLLDMLERYFKAK